MVGGTSGLEDCEAEVTRIGRTDAKKVGNLGGEAGDCDASRSRWAGFAAARRGLLRLYPSGR